MLKIKPSQDHNIPLTPELLAKKQELSFYPVILSKEINDSWHWSKISKNLASRPILGLLSQFLPMQKHAVPDESVES
jgi:hypothetical protein